MMTHPSTPEDHWKGPEGDAYVARQTLSIDDRRYLFQRAFRKMPEPPKTVIEFGASTGANLDALRSLTLGLHLTGVEINRNACETLALTADETINGSMLDFAQDRQWDMAFTRGVLIHIPPEKLQLAYEALYYHARRYILVAEYYSPRIEPITYRGKDGLLWRGPYAEQMLDSYPDLRVLDYGFLWRWDPRHPQDDVTWVAMEKKQ